MRTQIANLLRNLAEKLDGRSMIPTSWHTENVRGMNHYIRRVETYVIALEKRLPSEEVVKLRKEHGRFDTEPLMAAGAWAGE